MAHVYTKIERDNLHRAVFDIVLVTALAHADREAKASTHFRARPEFEWTSPHWNTWLAGHCWANSTSRQQRTTGHDPTIHPASHWCRVRSWIILIEQNRRA